MIKVIKYITGFLIVLFVLLGVWSPPPSRVFAQDACASTTCNKVYSPYTEYRCVNIYDPYGVFLRQDCQWVTVDRWICVYESGAGTCRCCYEGGCYFNCPGTGGGGGGDTAADPLTPTPTPVPVTLTAVARHVATSDTSCTAINTSTTGVNGTTFEFAATSANQPTAQVQSGSTAVTFSSQPSGPYTIVSTPPASSWVFVRSCVYRNGTLVGEGSSAVANAGDTIRWEQGYTFGTAWLQAEGADVYASGTLRSYIPAPEVFVGSDATGFPGVATYGTSYDFDASLVSQGETNVSTTDWLVNSINSSVHYYDYFYRRFGSPTTPTVFDNQLAVTKPATSTTPYYVVGNMETSGDWVVGNGENIVMIVNGNVTIGGRINVTGTGFITFIVNGTITVSDAVGTTASSALPVVEGIYIATTVDHTGSFATGPTTTVGSERFVGKGMFIADGFSLGRDLEGYGSGNTVNAAELFIYNPEFLVRMPDLMQELPVTWSEVAP